jgi:hypothetical protein
MNKPIALVVVLAAATATSGCGTLSRAIGAGKNSPDEFNIVTSAPLTLPPDYSLRPPRPGEPRPQEMAPGDEARAALFGQDVAAGASQGERRLVSNAGAEAVDPNIRDQIDYEAQGLVRRDEGFVNSILNFGGSSNPNVSVDANAEARRLEEQEAIRRATGGGQVTISRGGGRTTKLPGT